MRRGNWSVESTIGLLFTIIIAILALAIVSAIGLAAYAAMDTGPSQRIVQQVETRAMFAACASRLEPASASMPCHAI